MNLKLLIPTNNTISDNVSIIEHENKITQEELLLTIDAIDALIKHFKGSLSYNSPYVHYIKNVLITLSDWICTLGEYIIRINEGNKFETINYNITIISRLHLLEPQNKIITLQALKEIITNVDKLKQILLNIQNISPYQDKPSFNFHDIIKTHIHIELLLLEYELCISSLINTPQLAIKFALEFIKFANNRQLKSAAYLKIFFYMQDKLTSDASNLVLPNDGFYPIINQVFKEIQHDNSLVTILTELLYNATRYVTMKVFENKGLDKFVQDYTSYLSIYYHTNSSICHIMAGIYNIKIDTCIVNIFQREITNNDLKRIVNTAYDTFATITNNHWSYLNMESFKEAIDIYNILQEYQDQLTQNISQNEITEIKFLYLDKLNNHFTDDKYKDILYVINKQYIYMKQNIFYNNINNITPKFITINDFARFDDFISSMNLNQYICLPQAYIYNNPIDYYKYLLDNNIITEDQLANVCSIQYYEMYKLYNTKDLRELSRVFNKILDTHALEPSSLLSVFIVNMFILRLNTAYQSYETDIDRQDNIIKNITNVNQLFILIKFTTIYAKNAILPINDDIYRILNTAYNTLSKKFDVNTAFFKVRHTQECQDYEIHLFEQMREHGYFKKIYDDLVIYFNNPTNIDKFNTIMTKMAVYYVNNLYNITDEKIIINKLILYCKQHHLHILDSKEMHILELIVSYLKYDNNNIDIKINTLNPKQKNSLQNFIKHSADKHRTNYEVEFIKYNNKIGVDEASKIQSLKLKDNQDVTVMNLLPKKIFHHIHDIMNYILDSRELNPSASISNKIAYTKFIQFNGPLLYSIQNLRLQTAFAYLMKYFNCDFSSRIIGVILRETLPSNNVVTVKRILSDPDHIATLLELKINGVTTQYVVDSWIADANLSNPQYELLTPSKRSGVITTLDEYSNIFKKLYITNCYVNVDNFKTSETELYNFTIKELNNTIRDILNCDDMSKIRQLFPYILSQQTLNQFEEYINEIREKYKNNLHRAFIPQFALMKDL